MNRPPARLDPGIIARGRPPTSPDVPTLFYSDPRRGGDGSYVVNGNKADIQWRWRSAALNQVYAVALPASGAPVDAVVDFGAQGAGSGDSEVQHLWGNTVSGRRFAVQPQMGTPVNKYLSNGPISSSLVFGTAQLPGYLSSPLKCWANSDLKLNARSLTGLAETVNLGAFCRTYDDSGCQEAGDCRREAWLEDLRDYLPGWLVPLDKVNDDLSGPQVFIPPNGDVDLRFPPFTDGDFLAAWFLDDSTSSTGLEPVLSVSIFEEDTREFLTDWNAGISLRDFVACPTVNVAGFPGGGTIRAMSLKSPRGGWTHQIRRTSALIVRLSSQDPGTITYRGAFHGWTVGFAEPAGRRYVPRVDRTTSMPGAAAGLGGGTA